MSETAYNIDFTRLLPEPLKNDETMFALGRAIAGELQQNIQLARFTIIYPRIDELDETTLDILAGDFKVDWYDYEGTIEEKRKCIKECMFIHKYKGTKFAVKTALESVYSKVSVNEWFEYGGEPYHFNVDICGSTDDREKRARVLEKIQYYKNLRSVLDNVTFKIAIDTETVLHTAVRIGSVYKRIEAEVKVYGLE
ncbi:MAG: phage tail protein I [Ruminococcus sp.]|nr:phage tail protein I [Ruminococcus sp.]